MHVRRIGIGSSISFRPFKHTEACKLKEGPDGGYPVSTRHPMHFPCICTGILCTFYAYLPGVPCMFYASSPGILAVSMHIFPGFLCIAYVFPMYPTLEKRRFKKDETASFMSSVFILDFPGVFLWDVFISDVFIFDVFIFDVFCPGQL